MRRSNVLAYRLGALITALHSDPVTRTQCVDLQWALQDCETEYRDCCISQDRYHAVMWSAALLIGHMEVKYQSQLNQVMEA